MSEHTDQAVFLINSIKDEMAQLARVVVNALDDNRVDFWEVLLIGREGTDLGTAFMHAMRGASQDVQKEILRILEHGSFEAPADS